MANLGTLAVYLTANLDDFQKGMNQAQRDIGKLSSTIGGFAVAASAGVVAFGVASVKSFIAMNESSSKFDTVFRDISVGAQKTASDLALNYGIATSTAKQYLSDTGDLLTGFGFSQRDALDISAEVNKLAIDLASFTNYSGGAQGASSALTKALLGERESIKSLGIAIMEEDVKKRIATNSARGFVYATERQAKAIATLQLAQEQSKNAIGDYARTSDQGANQIRLFSERIKELKEKFGEMTYVNLHVAEILKYTNSVLASSISWLKDMDEPTKNIIINFTGIAVSITSLAVAAKALTALGLFQGIAALGVPAMSFVQATALWTSGIHGATLGIGTLLAKFVALPVAVGVVSFKIGEMIGNLSSVKDLTSESFFFRWATGADKTEAAEQAKSEDIFKKQQALRRAAQIRKETGTEYVKPKKIEPVIEIPKEEIDAQKKYNDMVRDAQISQAQGQEKINLLRVKAAQIGMELAGTKGKDMIDKRIEIFKADEDLAKALKEQEKKTFESQLSLNEKITDIKLKNAKSLDEKLKIIEDRRTQEHVRSLYEEQTEEEKIRMEKVDAEYNQNKKELIKEDEDKRSKYVAPKLAGAIEKGTVEAYRAELAGQNQDTAIFQQTAKNTDLTAKGVQQLVQSFKPFANMGVA